jgi:putative ABC transport system permease protein
MLEQNDYSAFVAMSDKLEDVGNVSDAIDKRLARNFGVSSRDINDADSKPYTIFNEATILKQLNQLGNALGSFLVVVAVISLIVGSIGIMNIMLVTVTERTREIGIMKALGFSSMDILLLFLVESVIISLLGGLLGLVLGIGGAYIVTAFLKLPFFYSSYVFVLGFAVAIIVGVLAGIYPARKAALLIPVEALRYQ